MGDFFKQLRWSNFRKGVGHHRVKADKIPFVTLNGRDAMIMWPTVGVWWNSPPNNGIRATVCKDVATGRLFTAGARPQTLVCGPQEVIVRGRAAASDYDAGGIVFAAHL